MTTLSEAINEYPAEWTHSEVFNAIQARTVNKTGWVWGAEVQKYLTTLGLVGYVKDTSDNTNGAPGFRDICIGLMQRFNPDGQIDFSNAGAVALLDVFFAESTVAATLSAQSVTAETAKATIIGLATAPVSEFPAVVMRDVIEIREPTLAQTTYSNELQLTGLSGRSVVILATIGAPPEPINPVVEIQHTYGQLSTVWRGSAVSGFVGVTEAGTYRFTLPEELISSECKVRVKVPYSVSVSLTNG